MGSMWGVDNIKIQYSADQVRSMLSEKARELGSQKALAIASGVSTAFLSDVITGRREPSGALLDYLRMRRVVGYVVGD